MTDCIFCKIAQSVIPTNLLYQDEIIVAFNDLNPKAPTHILVIPRLHIASLAELEPKHKDLLSHLMLCLPKIAKDHGLSEGFRTIINTGSGGGQEIFHLHAHILAGNEKLPGF